MVVELAVSKTIPSLTLTGTARALSVVRAEKARRGAVTFVSRPACPREKIEISSLL